MVTFLVQTTIEHAEYDDEDRWIDDYQKKLDAMSEKLSKFGVVDIMSEDSDRFEEDF
jgi:hypothetical protein